MSRVTIKPEILRWARERADRSVESLRGRFPRYELWERGAAAPTLKQLEAFAKAGHQVHDALRDAPPGTGPVPIGSQLRSRAWMCKT